MMLLHAAMRGSVVGAVQVFVILDVLLIALVLLVGVVDLLGGR